MSAPHRIRRQLWRIRASSPAAAFVLRREVRAAWDAVLLPALESAFDAAAGDDRVIRIPRLELRLRLGNAEELAVELPRLIHEAAVAELALARADGSAQPWETPAAAASPSDDAGATLLHYLSTGALPWAAASAPTRETVAMLRRVARLEGARLVGRVMAAPQPRAFAFRLLQLIDEDDVPGWTAALPSRVPPFWRRVFVRLLAPSAAPEPVPRYPIPDGATSDSAAPLAGATDPPPAKTGARLAPTAPPSPRWSPPPRHARLEAAALLLVEALAHTVDDTPQAVAAAAAEARHGGAGSPSAPLIASLPEVAAAREDAKRAAAPGAPAKPAPSAATAPTPTDAAEPVARVQPSRQSAPTEEFGIAIANAGLILLLPFIAPLLEHRAVREGDTIPPHALPRAAALLHYLATGSDEVMEWELALVKVLLGLTPEDPLPVADGCLTTEDRDECEHLLRSAVAHWSALRDASTEAVRATFLQRPGLLRRDAQGWTLRVEPAPFDILLAQLPWSISVARLPWMTHPIYTEWTP